MQLVLFASFVSTFLMGIAIIVIGRVVLKLRTSTFKIIKEAPSEELLKGGQKEADVDIEQPIQTAHDETNNWQSYTIKPGFADLLVTISWMLIIIGLIDAINSLVSFILAMNTLSMGGSYNIRM